MADFTKLNGYTVKDPQAVHTYDTVADLKADTKLKAGNHVQTKGYTTAGDDGHATYIIVDDNTLVDDGGSVHDLANGLKAVLQHQDIINTKQFGVVADGETDDTQALQSAINYCNGKVKELNISGTELYTTNYIDLQEVSNLTINFNTSWHRKSSESTNFGLRLSECKNVVINNIDIYSERDQTEPAPQDHTRVSSYGSNIIGIMIYCSENITINNAKFSNMSADFFNQRYNDTDAKSNNITINGWYSRNSSGGMFAQFINNLTIIGADILPATDMGNGDHCVYLSNCIENVYIKDSVFNSPDANFGIPVIFYNTGSIANNSTCPKNLFVDKCIFNTKLSFFSERFISNAKFTNCIINCDNVDIICRMENDSQLIIDNCEFNGNADYFMQPYSNISITLKNSKLINQKTDCHQFISSSAGTPKINIENNIIEWNASLIYQSGNVTNNVNICKNLIKQPSNTSSYLLSCRKTDGIVNFSYNIIENAGSYAILIYNGGIDSSHFNVYFNKISGFTDLANATEIESINANYNVI